MSAAALRRVSGRHHNKALAASRRTGAVELPTQGGTYDAIADELGHANRAASTQDAKLIPPSAVQPQLRDGSRRRNRPRRRGRILREPALEVPLECL